MTESEYRQALDRLYRLRRFGMRPGLETTRTLLGALDDPQLSFRSIHVTGSKGKGSVSAMAAKILGLTGRRTGRYTSPHLVSYRERMQVNGRNIPRAAVVEGVARVEEATEQLLRNGRLDRSPTFFETTTAVAFDWFRRQRVEQAVVEVGIGGRLDSTNVLDSPVGVITTIEAEHTDVLGPTIADIAREKAGILHRNMVGAVGRLPPQAQALVARRAADLGVSLWELGRELRVGPRMLRESGQRFRVETPEAAHDVDLPLLGSFQPPNAALAIAAVERFARATGARVTPEAIRRGLARTRWRGRLERVMRRPDLYLDVAHTVESAKAVAESLGEIAPFADPNENAILFGCLQDKPVDAILNRLSPLARTIVLAPIRSDRAIAPSELARVAAGHFAVRVQAPSVAEGLTLARGATGPDGYTLAVGSDYLIGELLRAVEGGAEDEPDLADPVGVVSADSAP